MKRHTKIFLFTTLDTRWSKTLSYAKINSVNHLYLIISKINGCIEGSNESKYLTLVSTDETKDTLKKHRELWNKIRDLIKSITNISDDYDEKYMKIKCNSDDDLLLKKMVELHNMIIVVRFVFHEENKYYPQDFLDECLYKLMLESDRIDASLGVDFSRINGS